MRYKPAMVLMSRRFLVAGGVGCLMMYSGPLQGQSSQGASGTSAVSDVVDPFARYAMPGQCERAAQRLLNEYWRDKRRDTVVYAPATDSVPVPVLHAVRRCAARFSIATVPPRELFALSQLYLWSRQDSLARRALDRFFRTTATLPPTARAWPLYEFVSRLLAVIPARVDLARVYLTQLDAAGVPAATWRMLAHTEMSRYAMSVNDRISAESEARAAIAASHQMSRNDRIDYASSIATAYEALTTPMVLTRSSHVARTVLDTAAADLVPLRPAGSRDRAELQWRLTQDQQLLSSYGKTGLPLVHGDRWYGATGDTIHPRRGVSTLLVYTGSSCNGACYEMFATLRRLHAEYGDRLDIVLMASTAGYFRDHVMPSADAEADSAGHYYLQSMQLPVTLAVERTPFGYIPDGRRRNDRTSNQDAFSLGGQGIVIDGTGTVRWIGNVDPPGEAVLRAVIGETMPAR